MTKSVIELRSDTFTRPTEGMMKAITQAEVGDDVWGTDPSVNALEAHGAALFGQEEGLFCPSGTMANQVALSVHLRPGDEVICTDVAHIHLYEGGGIAANTGASTHLISGDRGRFSAAQVRSAVKPDDPHAPVSKLVAIEDTCNRGGGAIWEMSELEAIAAMCSAHGLGLHLDGARVFNRLVATGESSEAYGRRFDSISVCLSKGLGAPIGSLLLGSKPFIRQARRVRKRMGGGMRQAGFMAAAGLYALQHQVQRLDEDHQHARQLAKVLDEHPDVTEVLPTETNIVLFRPTNLGEARWLKYLEENGILAAQMGSFIRFVTHLDVKKHQIDKVIEVLQKFSESKVLKES